MRIGTQRNLTYILCSHMSKRRTFIDTLIDPPVIVVRLYRDYTICYLFSASTKFGSESLLTSLNRTCTMGGIKASLW